MNVDNRYTQVDPENPYAWSTPVSSFGGPDDQEDNGQFYFGGGSIDEDGAINPEPYAAFPKELYDEGIVKPGSRVKAINPRTGQSLMVIARDVGPSAKNRGLDLAPHAMQELGLDTDEPAVVDFSTVTDPDDSSSEVESSGEEMPQLDPSTMGEPTLGESGEVIYPSGVTVHPDTGMVEMNMGGSRVVYDGNTGKKVMSSKVAPVKPNRHLTEFTDRKTGAKFKAIVDLDKGEVVKAFDEYGTPAKQTDAADAYAREKSNRVISSVDELLGQVGNLTAGPGGLILGNIPGTKARDFKAEMDTLKANIAFGELTEMRNASKTGGALGQVSDREATLLQSTLGALDLGQSPEHLKKQLTKIKSSIEKWQKIKEKISGAVMEPEDGEVMYSKSRDAYYRKINGVLTKVSQDGTPLVAE